MLFVTTSLRALNLENDYQATVDQIVELVKQQDFDLALKKTESALVNLEQLDSLYLFLDLVKSVGTQFRKEGQLELAKQLFRKALPRELWRNLRTKQENSKAFWTYVQLAFTYDTLGDYINARIIYELALGLADPKEEDAYLLAKFLYKPLGNIYTGLGEYSAGESILKQFVTAVLIEEDYLRAAQGYNDLGLLYSNWDKLENSQEAYENALKLPIDDRGILTMLLLNLSDLFIKENHLESAKTQLARAKEMLINRDNGEQVDTRFDLLLSNIYKKQALIHVEQGDFAACDEYWWDH